MTSSPAIALGALLSLATAAEAPKSKASPGAKEAVPGAASHAVAVLHSASGSNVTGTVHFHAVKGGVQVKASIKGLTPGTHGFHVHEFGDCTAADFASAGSHFNPRAQPHGAPADAKRHAGDLGNVEAASDGTASLDWTDPQMKLEGPHGVVGRGVIVHAKADDLKTQPTGDAGGRLACGVVGVAKAE